jgi:hypothetical protein
MTIADEHTAGGGPPAIPALDAETWAWIREWLERDHRLMRSLLQAFAEELMVVEADRQRHAPRAAAAQANRRNGYRPGAFQTAYGPIPVRIPRLRIGRYTPTWLAQRDDSTDDCLTEALCRAYVEGLSSELVARLLLALGHDSVPAEQPSMFVALKRRIEAARTRSLEGVLGADVVVDTNPRRRRHGGGHDVTVSTATTSTDGEPAVLGVAVSALGPETAVRELQRDLADRGVAGEVRVAEATPVRPPRATVTIAVRPHGRRHDEELDLPVSADGGRRPTGRIPVLLGVVAALALAAAVVGSWSANRFRSDPTPPPATTTAPATVGVVADVVEVSPPTAATSSVSPPPAAVAPPSVAQATTVPTVAAFDLERCTDALALTADNEPSAERLPWMNRVQCEAAASPPPPG